MSRLLVGGGDMGDLMRSIDWSQTPVGPIERWPSSLRTMVNLTLGSEVAMFVLWGPELVQLYNDGARLVLGSGKHPAAMGQRARDCWREIWAVISPMYQHVLAGGATRIHDGMLVLERSGFPEECYFDYAYTPIRDESGSVAGIFATVSETTAHVISTRRLALLRELAVRTALAKSVDEVLNAAGDVLRANGADVPFALLYARREESAELLLRTGLEEGSPAAPLLSQERDLPWPLEEVIVSGTARTIERLSESAAGELHAGPWPESVERAFLIPVSLAADKDAVFVAGLSPRLPADDEYRDFLGLLAGQLAAEVSRVRALEHEKLRASQLAELDRQKTTFFSNVSHEFRTPLTLILGPTEDALASPTRTLQGESLERVHGNAQRLLRLVNTLLEFSRVEAGRTRASFRPTDLATLTAGLANAFESVIVRADVALVVDCPPLPEPVWVDPELWEKVVLNLVSNAFKFTLAGRISVQQKWTGRGVELRVEDTGIGIPAKDLPHVFERFHQVEGAHGRSHEGSGIGLSLVQALMSLHGGQVTVSSGLESGTTFTVNLPAGNGHLPPDQLAQSSERHSQDHVRTFVREAQQWQRDTGAAPDGKPPRDGALRAPATDGHPSRASRARVLLADDNTDMRAYLDGVLSEHFEVTTVADGASALEAIKNQSPDVVVSDVMMPGLDGIALTRALRAGPRTERVPVLLLSARASEDDRVEGLAAGAVDYIIKPFSARELVARIRAALSSAVAHAATEAERRKQHELFMQAPVAIAILEGHDLLFTFANPAYRALVGGREVVGKTLHEALPDIREQGFDVLLRQVMTSGEPYAAKETPIQLAHLGEGERLFLTFNYTPMRGATGQVLGVLVSCVDVTDQVLARRRVEALIRLEQEARHQAEEASRLKDEFLATVSHELRTPLNAMLGWAQMLRSGAVPADREDRALDTIERNARSQAQLIEDLLDMSRILTGKLRLETQPVDVRAIVEAALESIRPAANARDIRLQPALDTRAVVLGDADRLQQVVWNLFTNAVKFTPKGGRVQVLLQCLDSAVELTVIDSGQGIPADFLPYVFERFRQADGGTSKTTGGLGLGLSIVRQLVEMHGGTITAASDGEGKGASFTVNLPLSNPVRGEPETSPGAEPISVLTPGSEIEGLRILVIDDEADAREMVAFLLETSGAIVEQAASAAGGRQSFSIERPDIVVSDIGMPGEDGYSFIRSIRQLPAEQGGDVPAVALTAYARSEDRTAALTAGFTSYVAKPVRPAALMAAIVSLVRDPRFQRG